MQPFHYGIVIVIILYVAICFGKINRQEPYPVGVNVPPVYSNIFAGTPLTSLINANAFDTLAFSSMDVPPS